MAQDLAKGGNDIYGADDMLLASTDAPESPQGGALVPPPGIGAGVEDPDTARSGVAVPSTPPHVPTLDARSRVDASHQTPKRQNDAGTQCFPGFSGPLSARKDGDTGFLYYGEPPKPVIIEKKVTNWKRTGIIAFVAAAVVALIVGLSVGLTVGKNNGGAVTTSVSPYSVTLAGLPDSVTPAMASAAITAAGKQLRSDVATGAKLPTTANVYVTEARDASSGTVLTTFPRTHPANAATGVRMLKAGGNARALQSSSSVNAITVMFEIESPSGDASSVAALLAAATLNGVSASTVLSAATLSALAGALGVPADSIIITATVAKPSLVPRPTASATAAATSTATSSTTASARPTITTSATASASVDYYSNPREFQQYSIVTTRVDTSLGSKFGVVTLDEYHVNNFAREQTQPKPACVGTLCDPFVVKLQSFALDHKGCTPGTPCVTVPVNDVKTGQITLSQDRCYLTVGGADVPDNTPVQTGTFSTPLRLGFALITKYDKRVNNASYSIQYHRNDANTTVVARSADKIPRAVGYGRSRSDTSTRADNRGNLYWIDNSRGGASSYLKAVRFEAKEWMQTDERRNLIPEPVELDVGNGMMEAGSCLTFATDQTNPPGFYQHLLALTEYTFGAVRVWPEQPAAGNTPCVGATLTSNADPCQRSYTLHGPYGTSSSDPSKLGGCAAYFKTEATSSNLNVVFFSERGAKAAVTRGWYAHGGWLTQESLWPETERFQSEEGRDVLALTFSSEMYALFAVTRKHLYMASNPMDYAFLVRWYPQDNAALDGTNYEYRGVATIPRTCSLPPAGSQTMTPSASPTKSSTASSTRSMGASVSASASASAQATVTATRSAAASATAGATSSVSATGTPSPTPSSMPIPFTFGNVVLSRVQKFANEGCPTCPINTLGRVYIEEWRWPTNATRAVRAQEWHFPHRERNSMGASESEPFRLTLPWDDATPAGPADRMGLGQVTLSQDACSIAVTGLNVPASHVGDNSLFDPATGAPTSTSDPVYRAFGYPVTVARVGGRGWRDYPATGYAPNYYKHWLPDLRPVTNGAPGLLGAWPDNFNRAGDNGQPEPLFARRWQEVPKAATLSGVESDDSRHGFQVYVVTNERAINDLDTVNGSVKGRCWYGKDASGVFGGASNDFCRGTGLSSVTSPWGTISTHPNNWTTVDPGNTNGTSGLCFVGSSTFFDQRLLQVRMRDAGAIFSWPESVGGGYDPSYTPFLDGNQYSRRAPYAASSISKYAQQESIPEFAGYIAPGSNFSPYKFGNCAGKATAYTGVKFETGAVLFYALRDAGAYSVSRTMWGSAGFWQAPQPVWNKPAADATLSQDVLSVAYFNEASVPVLYAVTRSALFGTSNTEADSAAVTWFRLHTIADPANNEYRGIAMAPRTCVYQRSQYRELAAGEEAVAKEADAQAPAMQM